MVTEKVALVCNGASVNDDGMVKFFGSQSSRKNPIVPATGGSIAG
jgi:hypothetical protein